MADRLLTDVLGFFVKTVGGGGTADDGKVMAFLPSGGIQASATTGYAIAGRSWQNSDQVGALYGEASGAGMGIAASSTLGYGANIASSEGIGMRVIAAGQGAGAGNPIAMFQDTWNYTKRFSIMRGMELQWEWLSGGHVCRLTVPSSPGGSYNWSLPVGGGTLAVDANLVHITGTENVTGNKKFYAYSENQIAATVVGGTCTLSLATSSFQTLTLTASTLCTVTMPAVTAGKSFTLMVRQPGTTGNGSAAFTGVQWGAAGAPVITTAINKMDIISFISDGAKWYGSYVQGFTYAP